MFRNLLNKVWGDPNEKELERLQPIVEEINALEESLQNLSDAELKAQTPAFRGRLQAGETMDDILPEAFALVREAAKRTVYMRPFDVQLIGGIVLHQGKVAEMKTGEGKTLAATLPLYLNALTGRGAHLVTVNDYLARRDVQWMGPIYHLLGISVGLLQQEMESFLYDPTYTSGKYLSLRPVGRQEVYGADITYGTNHEFGFDYLRDNLAYRLEDRVQRELHYAIIDEVDNILIDEARTPLIISGPSDEPIEEYHRFAEAAKKLKPDIDYELDTKERSVVLTEAGLARVEQEAGIANLYDESNVQYVQYMEQALKAQALYRRGRDYILQGRNVVLVDEFTGRLMPDRRLSDGLHQAIEAKEGVRIKPRTMTNATITIQNYFRMYDKLAGMTGTALTEAEEFHKTYELDVVVIPTNEPMIRQDREDMVYRTEEAKWRAIVREIESCHRSGRPVLVGTTSVEKSEKLSRMLKKQDTPHAVLNAKNHTKEAAIIARAGEPGAVTVATNMAGRGVDIKLGGDLSEATIEGAHQVLRERGIDPFRATPEQFKSAIAEVDPDYALRQEKVLSLGGLHILGTERHEARRIDNQLRGRSGRQGDPGSSRFYLSLQDDLMRRFGGSGIASLMERFGVEDDIPLEHGLVSKSIESAQTRVEGYHFDIRKHLLEYDDVLNRQRELIYGQRYRILTESELLSDLWRMIEERIDDLLDRTWNSKEGREWELAHYLDIILPLSSPYTATRSGKRGRRGRQGQGQEVYEVFSYPFTLPSGRTCLPPFSVLFLAEKAEAGKPAPAELGSRLGDMVREGLAEYKSYLLENAVRETFEKEIDRYRDQQEAFFEGLEARIYDYVGLAEERGQAVNNRTLLQQVRDSLPFNLDIKPSELGSLEVDEVKDRILAASKVPYHQWISERLIRTVLRRVPKELRPEAMGLTDLEAGAAERLFEQAQASAPDEQARARLERAQRKARTQDNFFEALIEINANARLELGILEQVFLQTVDRQYDKWAEQQMAELDGRLSRELKSDPSDFQNPKGLEEDIVQLLLKVLEVRYVDNTALSRGHTARFPLPFIVVAQMRDSREEELRQNILAHLEQAMADRQRLWSEQEMARLEKLSLAHLDADSRAALERYCGQVRVGDNQERLIGDLDDELRRDIFRCLKMRQVEGQKLSDLEMGADLLEYLGRDLAASLRDQRVSDLDRELSARIEGHLQRRGYFDDPASEARLLERRVGDLDDKTQESLAALLGQKLLADIENEIISDLDEEMQHHILAHLKSRGYFVDEERMQHFFIHQRVSDLGDEVRRQACQYLSAQRVDSFKRRKIRNLDIDTRQKVMGYLREEGFLWNEGLRQLVAQSKLATLDRAAYDDLARPLGAEELPPDSVLADLSAEVRREVWSYLRGKGYLTDEAQEAALLQRKLADLGPEYASQAERHLLQALENSLSERPIADLEPDVQERVYGYLNSQDYFVDQAKAGQLARQTLANLEGGIYHDLEQHIGDQMMEAVKKRKFFNLDQATRESILHYLDVNGLYRKKSRRRRLMEQKLEDLERSLYVDISHHLGRERLAAIKQRRFSELPPDLQQSIQGYLKTTDYFVDEDKKLALPEMRVAALGDGLGRKVHDHLASELRAALKERRIGALGESVVSELRRYLDDRDYFLDEAKAAHLERVRLGEMGAYDALCQQVGYALLAPCAERTISDLDEGLQRKVWHYLESTDLFVDRDRLEEYRQKRLIDLEQETYQNIIHYIGHHLEMEIGQERVGALPENLRQGLRRYLDEIGHFLNREELARFSHSTLATYLRKSEYPALALSLGQWQLADKKPLPIAELEPKLREAIRQHLRAEGHFVDQERREKFRAQKLSDLEEEVYADLMRHLRARQEEDLRERRINTLEPTLQRQIRSFLHDRGLTLDERERERFETQRLIDLEAYDDILQLLGRDQVEEIAPHRIADLDEKTRATIAAYLGQQMVSQISRDLMLGVISHLWIDYLTAIEELREGIGLEAYGQRDPLVEYKRRAFEMFGDLEREIQGRVVSNVFRQAPQPLRLVMAASD